MAASLEHGKSLKRHEYQVCQEQQFIIYIYIYLSVGFLQCFYRYGEVSNWKSVLSGVPQGSVLGPILFLIYINDLDDDITSKVLKFADDTKVFRKIESDADRQQLQDDLNKLNEWSDKW